MMDSLKEKFSELYPSCGWKSDCDMATVEVPLGLYRPIMEILLEDFCQLTDLTVVDWLTYKQAEWEKDTKRGLSRAQLAFDFSQAQAPGRFSVIVHLLSYKHNTRLRIKVALDAALAIASVTDLWSGANWYEREAFDLFGIEFTTHPDLRRLLTDYGFSGYPFRKDFPMLGFDQIIYDGALERCRMEPVNIIERTVVPKIIRGEGSS